ncbi:hypothetical protein VTN31DRAFT_122 [Thermomyces dupontii]|uniref:uncharacterized protein n=1 Tax=Talaromyces thermophilus TaxID=28565 RepID=UPI003743BEA4
MYSLFGFFSLLLSLIGILPFTGCELQMVALFGAIIDDECEVKGGNGRLFELGAILHQLTAAIAADTFVIACLLSMAIVYGSAVVEALRRKLSSLADRRARGQVGLGLTKLLAIGREVAVAIYRWFDGPLNPCLTLLHWGITVGSGIIMRRALWPRAVAMLDGFSAAWHNEDQMLTPACWDLTHVPGIYAAGASSLDEWSCVAENAALELRALGCAFLDGLGNFEEDNVRHLPIVVSSAIVTGVLFSWSWFLCHSDASEQLRDKDELIEEVWVLRTQLLDLLKVFGSWQSAVADLREAVVASQGSLARALTLIGRLLNRVTELTRQLAERESERTQLRQRVAQLGDANRGLLFKVQDLEDDRLNKPYNPGDVRSLKEQLDASRREAADAASEGASLGAKIDALRRAILAAREGQRSSERTASAARNDLAATLVDRDRNVREALLLQRRISGLEAENSALRVQQQEATVAAQLSLVAQERDAVLFRLDQFLEEREWIVGCGRQLEAELAEVKAQLAAQRLQAEQAFSESGILHQVQDRLVGRVDALKQALKNSHRRFGEFFRQRADLRDQRDRLRSDLLGSQRAALEYMENNRALEQRFAELDQWSGPPIIPRRQEDELKHLTADLQRMAADNARKTDEISRLKQQIADLRASGSAVHSGASQQGEVERLRSELAATKRALSDDEVNSRRRITELEQEARRLRISLSNASMFSGRGRGSSPLRGFVSPLRGPSRGRGGR